MQKRKDVLEEKQCVILKGRKDGISILLDDKADFDLIKDVLRKRVAGSRNFFDGATTAVTFKGRKLSVKEEKTLMDIVRYEANINIETIPDEDIPFPGGSIITPISPLGMAPSISRTYYYHGCVRSGQTIKQGGSVVVIGDVNPGGVVEATGNIIVLGALRGMAWAGIAPNDTSEGDASCFVSALDFKPTHLRIAHVVTYIPPESLQSQPQNYAAWAYIQDGSAYIAPLQGAR